MLNQKYRRTHALYEMVAAFLTCEVYTVFLEKNLKVNNNNKKERGSNVIMHLRAKLLSHALVQVYV
jgi:hypothetical protein